MYVLVVVAAVVVVAVVVVAAVVVGLRVARHELQGPRRILHVVAR